MKFSKTGSRKIIIFFTAIILSLVLCACSGPQGDKGDPGEKGIPGDDGKSAYELALESGFTGSLEQWIESLKGEAGAKGETGAKGEDGKNGQNGSDGKDGLTPHIGENGNWWIGNTDTNVKAEGIDGSDGKDGLTPHIGENGNWWIGNTDTNVKAEGIDGSDGKDGLTPHIGENGNWWIGNTDTNVKAEGSIGEKGDKGDIGATGKSAFELYCEIYGYDGSEEQWISDLVSGKLKTYTVTFDLNGGTAGAGYAESVKVFGGGIVDLTIPTKEGHTFIGWYTGETVNDGIFTSTTPVKSDITLIARWQINSFTVKFVGNNGATLKYQKVNYGEAAEAPTAPTIDKLKFIGWDTDFSCVKGNLTIKSMYVSNVYEVTYNTNGGSEIPPEKYYIGDIPVEPDAPTKNGYYFIGWYLDSVYTSEYKFDTALTENTVLYAYFNEMKPIRTAEDLRAIANDTSSKYYLANDIDLEGATWTPISFSGVFDGSGHKIHNFTVSSNASVAGFFTQNSGTLKNITFSDFSFSIATDGTTFNAGGIAGTNSGTIDNCHIKDAVLSYSFYKAGSSGTYNLSAGGITGQNNGTISNCSVEAEMSGKIETYISTSSESGYSLTANFKIGGISGINGRIIKNTVSNIKASFLAITTTKYSGQSWYPKWKQTYSILCVGGLVGNNNGTISKCSSYAEINTSAVETASGNDTYAASEAWLGGFVGDNGSIGTGTISECIAQGSISVDDKFTRAVIGGFVQLNRTNISNCYSTVDINIQTTGSTNIDDAVGGFVANNSGTVSACYSSGNITTATKGQVGGFVGRNVSGASISKSFCTGDITLASTPANIGYFVGFAEGGSTLFKCYYNNAMKITRNGAAVVPGNTDGTATTVVSLQSKELLFDTLSWNDTVWEINTNGYPTFSKNTD